MNFVFVTNKIPRDQQWAREKKSRHTSRRQNVQSLGLNLESWHFGKFDKVDSTIHRGLCENNLWTAVYCHQ